MTTEDHHDLPEPPDTGNRLPALVIDWELYGQYLADSDLSEADKRLLIETLWSIMVSFVDLGFSLSPVAESCGLVEGETTEAGSVVLDCEAITATRAFEGAAADVMASSSERRSDAS